MKECQTKKQRNTVGDCEEFMLENAMSAKHHEIRKTEPEFFLITDNNDG